MILFAFLSFSKRPGDADGEDIDFRSMVEMSGDREGDKFKKGKNKGIEEPRVRVERGEGRGEKGEERRRKWEAACCYTTISCQESGYPSDRQLRKQVRDDIGSSAKERNQAQNREWKQ